MKFYCKENKDDYVFFGAKQKSDRFFVYACEEGREAVIVMSKQDAEAFAREILLTLGKDE